MKLSNTELDASLKRLVASERKILHLILEHINEVDSRKIYLEMAYASLYEYLVKECKYSGSAAMRRISAARLMREVPVLSEKIQTGAINLSQIGELFRSIKEKEKSGVVVSTIQKKDLVASISGKTTAETQKEISVELDLEIKIPEKQFVQKDDSVRMELTLTREHYELLMKCKDSTAHALLSEDHSTSAAEVIGFLASYYLKNEKIDEGTFASKKATKSISTAVSKFSDDKLNKSRKSSRINNTLTPRTRREILLRDKCCQFKDAKSGKICGSTFNLEIDHKRPRWAGGDHSMENLQVLCKAHNVHKYQKEINLRLL